MRQTTRNGISLAVSAFFVTWARYLAQYGYAPWKGGLFNFITAWIIHYIALMIVCGSVLIVRGWTDGFLLPNYPKVEASDRIEKTIVSVAQTLFVVSILFLILKVITPIQTEVTDYGEF